MDVLWLLLQADASGLEKLLASIPHDAPAIFVYLLTGAALYLIWRGSRKKGGR